MKKMTAEQNKRLKKLIFRTLATLLVLAAYYVAVKLIGKGIPCVLYLITDKYCPGCGITRALMALIEGDLVAAIGYNAYVVLLLLPALAFGARRAYVYVKCGDEFSYNNVEKVLLLVAFVLMIAFTVMRNMPEFAFLAP